MNQRLIRGRKIYFPIVDLSHFHKKENYTNHDENDNNLQFFRLKVSNNCKKIDNNWLKVEIIGLLNYGIGNANIFKLFDQQNNELCICQFIQKYNTSGNLFRYFQYDENCIYYSKGFGKITKIV